MSTTISKILRYVERENRDYPLSLIDEEDVKMLDTQNHIYEGLIVAINHFEEVCRLVLDSEDNSKATEALCSTLNLSEKQVREILKMRLKSFTEMEKAKLRYKACVVKRTYHLKLEQLKSEEA